MENLEKQKQISEAYQAFQDAEDRAGIARKSFDDFLKDHDWSYEKMSEEEKIQAQELWDRVEVSNNAYDEAYKNYKRSIFGDAVV